ncbi:MAG: outer membrane protein assembly factor BamC [Arenicellales bacterium]|nr:outer membrane protein assembly factor BamC [Arenicellales bacterium]
MAHSLHLFRQTATTALLVLALQGCGSTEKIDRSQPAWNASGNLEVPPDLTAPREDTNTQLFSAAMRDATAEEQDQFAQFEQFQKMAEYQEFLKWRETHGAAVDLSLTAFRAAKNETLITTLTEQGVLVANVEAGQQILLIGDTLSNSWNRIDTAILNMGLQLVAINRAAGYFDIHYGNKSEKENGLLSLTGLRRNPLIYRLRVQPWENGVSITIYDDKEIPVTTPVGNALIQRLGVQLKTFAGKDEQFVVGGSNLQQGLSLHETPAGRLQLTVPGATTVVWARLDRALADAGFSVAGRDRAGFSFAVRYDDPDRQPPKTFLQKLVIWKKDRNAPAQTYSLQLTPVGEVTRVDALDDAKQRTETGDRILRVLFDSLKAGTE